jgi:Helix-loop-helix DNA-binding domain
MEISSSIGANDKSLWLEGPNVMQQALQTFQTDSNTTSCPNGEVTPTETAVATQQQQQSLSTMTFPQHFMNTIPVPLAQLPAVQQQQQLQWQQALQTLVAAQQPHPPFGGPITDVTQAAVAAAAAVPFLASLTTPHLMHFNNMQHQQVVLQQQQQLQRGQQHPQGTSAIDGFSTIQTGEMPPPPTACSVTNTATSGSTTKRRASRASEKSNLKSSATPTRGRKHYKRTLTSGKDDNVSAVISLSGSNSTSALTTSTTNYSAQHDHESNNIEGMDNLQPPLEKSAAAIEKMSAAERRRYERNLREQQRSYRISQQIKELRDVLQESNVPFRPNKYSILVSVAEYIQQLQSRAIMLDSEHQRLINTIRSTKEGTSSNDVSLGKVSKGSSFTSSTNGDCGDEEYSKANLIPHSEFSDSNICPDSLLVPGIDYQAVFFHCPYPLGVATLDGRIISSNSHLELLLNPGYDNDSMIDQSFFVFIQNHQEIFEAMAALLKQSTALMERGEGILANSPNLFFWHGQVVSTRNEVVSIVF